MEGTVYDVVPDAWSGGWRLERRGSGYAMTYRTRMEAVERGDERCRASRPSRLLVQNREGRILEARTYIDPCNEVERYVA